MKNQEIYNYLLQIPYGKVTTYRHIGQKFGLHPRTVGMIMLQNILPESYPCYKVVASDGKLTGYILRLEQKEKRLKEEGIHIRDGKVEQKYIWEGKKIS